MFLTNSQQKNIFLTRQMISYLAENNNRCSLPADLVRKDCLWLGEIANLKVGPWSFVVEEESSMDEG